MKQLRQLQGVLLLLLAHNVRAASVYYNSFDTAADVADFTTIGAGAISIDNQQLRVTVASSFGSTMSMLDTRTHFAAPYVSTLAQNSGPITWAFNVSNENGAFNNGFRFVLASDQLDSFSTGARGYYFGGGDMLGNRMGLWRFDSGLAGGQEVLVDVMNGLGPFPEAASMKITYDPGNNQWALFALIGEAYSDPLAVTSLLGAAIDGRYTTLETPYVGLGGLNSGNDFFDNVAVTIVPEPTAAALLATGMLVLLLRWALVQCARS